MRADRAIRHNAAVGAILGLAVGDALAGDEAPPERVCPGETPVHRWGPTAEHAFVEAERLLRGHPVDLNITPTTIVPCCVRLGIADTPAPLLVDHDASLIANIVRGALGGDLHLDRDLASSDVTRDALGAGAAAPDFVSALAMARDNNVEAAPLIGALAGLRWGPAAIPSTWTTGLYGAVGDRNYSARQLVRLGERLLGEDAPVPPEPRISLGPSEVAPGLWLSNLHAVTRFVATHPDGAVVSLCPTTGSFDRHRFRREFMLHDAAGGAVNPHLRQVVDDVLSTIGTFRSEGRPVLVHCHHGASRTGLILRSWLVDELGLSADDATTEAQAMWPKTSTWNHAFSAEVRRRASAT